MRTIIFRHRTGMGEHEIYEEEFQFEDNITEENIQEEYEQWVWQQIGDEFTWYEKK